MTHYTAEYDTTYGAPDDAWCVRDWHGMRIVWNLTEREAMRQCESLATTSKIARPVVHIGICDAWCCRQPTVTPTPEPEEDTTRQTQTECYECGDDTPNDGMCDTCISAHDTDKARLDAFWNAPTVTPEPEEETRYVDRPVISTCKHGRELREDETCPRCRRDEAWYPWYAPAFKVATIATLALALLATIPHGCTIVGATGEGFPLAHCADDTYGYVDLDGTDGSLGTAGDGRWVQLP